MGEDSLERIEQLEARVRHLESSVRALHTQIDDHAAATQPAAWSAPPQGPAAWPAPEVATGARPTRAPMTIDSETLLKWGGVGLVVLAVGFAASTAISRGWIGPELQLAGALAIALGLMATGIRLRPTRPRWTHALCSGGVVALVTTFASDLFIDQASDGVAFAATALAAAAGLALARFVRSEWVASVTLAGATIGWFVIADTDPPVRATMIFVVALAALGLAVSLERGWHAVRLVAHLVAMIVVFGMSAEIDRVGDRPLLLGAAGLLAASLFWTPSIGDLTGTWQQLEVQLTIATAPWAFAVVTLTLDLDDDTQVGLTALAVTLGTALAAVGLRRWIRPAHFVSLAIGASTTLSIGLAILLSTTAAFTALAVQGAGLVVLSRSFGGSVRVLVNAAVLLGIAGIYAVIEMVEAWSDDVSLADDVGHLVIIAAIGTAAWQTRHDTTRRAGALVVLALVLIWLGSVLVHLPQGQAAVSIAWAIIGTTALVAGALRRRTDVGVVGLVVLALTVGKLLTVDLQEVDTLWRAGLFLLVGLGFLRLGFLLPRLEGGDDDG